ncbi:unnamed protein product [Rotaria magnacalcarata]|uniref:Uncharacterized protein n=1 Tax=Rotaria magnacalcarata TaxID=392030 RepID=A0A815MG55_9BILA|nr:unnamed protein product [Rotaria magnacalcarata]CAF3754183.1 unnamed protein product [Rotaria magnacalcarata]
MWKLSALGLYGVDKLDLNETREFLHFFLGGAEIPPPAAEKDAKKLQESAKQIFDTQKLADKLKTFERLTRTNNNKADDDAKEFSEMASKRLNELKREHKANAAIAQEIFGYLTSIEKDVASNATDEEDKRFTKSKQVVQQMATNHRVVFNSPDAAAGKACAKAHDKLISKYQSSVPTVGALNFSSLCPHRRPPKKHFLEFDPSKETAETLRAWLLFREYSPEKVAELKPQAKLEQFVQKDLLEGSPYSPAFVDFTSFSTENASKAFLEAWLSWQGLKPFGYRPKRCRREDGQETTQEAAQV